MELIWPSRINYIATFSSEPILVSQLFSHPSQFWSLNPFLMILSIKELCGWLLNSKFNVFACSDGSKSRPGLFLGLRLKFLVEDENLRLKLFCSGSLCSINCQTGFLGLDPSLFANLIDSADKSPFWISKFECVYILSIAE